MSISDAASSPPTRTHDQVAAVVWDRRSLLFTACNEDTRSELRAFGSLEGQRVLCVTAGGGRVLSLLTSRPASIVAVDLNPSQNALLELKIAAMRRLDHAGYLRFLGVHPCDRRRATYEDIRATLSPDAQEFFDRTGSAIEAGILFQGKLERFLSRIARAVSPFGVGRLLEAESVDAQSAVLRRLETGVWRLLVETICRRSVLERFSGDPGFFRYLPSELRLHEELYARIHEHLHANLLRDNPVLQLAFQGRYVWEAALPLYLNAGSYDRVRAALSETRIEIVSAAVNDVLDGRQTERFDAYSLSDISSYLDQDAHDRLFDRVAATAADRARMCSRSNIHHRPLPKAVAQRLGRDRPLERDLRVSDHACVHDFVVGELA